MKKAFDMGVESLGGGVVVEKEEVRNARLPLPLGGGVKANLREQNDGTSLGAAGKSFFIETFGCQMNDHDSEKVAGVLQGRGYWPVGTPALADLVLYNTCSIREK